MAAGQPHPDFDGPADNAVARAWLAITYLASDCLEVELHDAHIVGRVFTDDASFIFTHVIPIGYTLDSPMRERVYLLAVLEGGCYRKTGLMLELAYLNTVHDRTSQGSIVLC